MIQPILLVVQPLHLDYPLFRFNVDRFRKYFASVWVALSNHYQEDDLSNFMRAQMPYANFVNVKHKKMDWRNDAINETLDKIKTNEPILFIEQDFFIKDDSFFEKVFAQDNEFIYYMEGERTHPAFALVSRRKIEETSRDFSAIPPKDHFGKFFDELSSGVSLEELGVKREEDFYHLNGLSQNYMNVKYDDPLHRQNAFLYYNYKCLSLPIENHPKFYQTELGIDRKMGHPKTHPFLDKFFP